MSRLCTFHDPYWTQMMSVESTEEALVFSLQYYDGLALIKKMIFSTRMWQYLIFCMFNHILALGKEIKCYLSSWDEPRQLLNSIVEIAISENTIVGWARKFIMSG